VVANRDNQTKKGLCQILRSGQQLGFRFPTAQGLIQILCRTVPQSSFTFPTSQSLILIPPARSLNSGSPDCKHLVFSAQVQQWFILRWRGCTEESSFTSQICGQSITHYCQFDNFRFLPLRTFIVKTIRKRHDLSLVAELTFKMICK
jgi:hypothetical protein